MVTLVLYTGSIILCWDDRNNLINIGISSNLLWCCVSLLSAILVVVFPELLALSVSELGKLAKSCPFTLQLWHPMFCAQLFACAKDTTDSSLESARPLGVFPISDLNFSRSFREWGMVVRYVSVSSKNCLSRDLFMFWKRPESATKINRHDKYSSHADFLAFFFNLF